MDVEAVTEVSGDLNAGAGTIVSEALHLWHKLRCLNALATLALFVASPWTLLAQDCKWSPLVGDTPGGVSFAVTALSVYDDGTGPALYAGGVFENAGGVRTNNIAKWDGKRWTALSGPRGVGVDGAVYALAVYDDGSGPALYAGGSFSTAGGIEANHIAKWNGREWLPLAGSSGNGVAGDANYVLSLAVFNDGAGSALYAGGAFTSAGGLAANNIAKWNGVEWSALTRPSGNGVDNWVLSLAPYRDSRGNALYVGGFFKSAGGIPISNLARWSSSGWSALSATPDGSPMDLTPSPGLGTILYVGGGFYTAGGQAVHNVGAWDGTSWAAFSGPAGNGTNNAVRSLAVVDDGSGPALFAAGDFDSAGGVATGPIAKWDSHRWQKLGGPGWSGRSAGDPPFAEALAEYDDGTGPALYVGGFFSKAGGVAASSIARWKCQAPPPTRLPAPTPVSPGSPAPPGPSILATTPTFMWTPVAGADGYGFYLSQFDGSGYTVILDSTSLGPPISGTTYTLPAGYLTSGNRYRWSVSSHNAAGYGSRSSELNLQVEEFSKPCVPSPTALCLNRGRFRVEVSWRDFSGNTGLGHVVQGGTSDAGVFWFFDPSNWEMSIKVLDGCGLNERFWVFAAATTNVAYTLQVTDTITGEIKSYSNPLGQSAHALTDTDAFSTCRAAASAASEPVPLTRTESGIGLSGKTLKELTTFIAQSSCVSSDTQMCLGDGRFKVTVSWKDFEGRTGVGKVSALQSNTSGFFWFFGPTNLELLVKIVNGCPLNERVWFFAAATTNVQYEIEVTDTYTGEVRKYQNKLGVAAPAVTDAGAFQSCSAAVPPRIEFASDRSVVLRSIGEEANLEVRVLSSNGQAVPDATVTWTSSQPDAVSVMPTGARTAVVKAHRQPPVSVVIRAIYGNLEADALVLLAVPTSSTLLISSLDVLEQTASTLTLRSTVQTRTLAV